MLDLLGEGGEQRVIVIAALDLIIAISGHDSEDKIMTQISDINYIFLRSTNSN